MWNKRMGYGILLTVGIVALCLISTAVGYRQTGSAETRADKLTYSGAELPPQTKEPAVTLETLREASFTDLPAVSADYDTACYAVYYGLLSCDDKGNFDPNAPANRGDVVAALYTLSGETIMAEGAVYTDVAQDSPYADAVVWASGAGIAGGTAKDTFSPQNAVTRNQLAVMLCRFAARRGDDVEVSGDLSAYRDGSRVADYAKQSVTWALEKGLYRTLVTDTIYPTMPVSRIQLAQTLLAMQSGKDDLAAQIWAAVPSKSAAGSARNNHEAIQAAVDQAAKKYGAVGVQVAVVENGQVTDTYAYGWATKQTDPMTTDHKLRVASLSKVLVGTTAMILREDGVIDLDASIGDYWGFPVKNPRYPNTPVSIRTILTHTSSIFNAGDNEPRAYSNVKSRLQGSGFSSAVPGDLGYWSYNNYAFGVLGMTLELASGQYVDDILNQRLFSAMGIDGSFSSGEVQNKNLLTTLYRNDGSVSRTVSAQKNLRRWESPGASGSYFAGGLTISASDLGKVVALLSQDGRYEGVQLLDAESVALMETYSDRTVPGGSHQAMPLRYWDNIYGRKGLYYHTGSAYGVYNCLSYDPVTGDGVVVLSVGASGAKDSYGIYSVCAEISSYIYNTIQ